MNKMTNTLGNQSNRRKTKYDTRPAETLKERVMSVKPIPKKKERNIEEKVETSNELELLKNKQAYLEFKDYVVENFENAYNIILKGITFDDKEELMKGSNPYAVVALNMFLKDYSSTHSVATQEELEANLGFIKDTYQDAGLLLDLSEEEEEEKAKYILNRLEDWKYSSDDFPLWLNYRGLELTEDLNFNPINDEYFVSVPKLNMAFAKFGHNDFEIDIPGVKKTEKKDPEDYRTYENNSKKSLLRICSTFPRNNIDVGEDFHYSDADGRIFLVMEK
jgi:hypothetical protein